MIQPGTYRARAIAGDVAFGRAGTGTEQIAVPFAITDERADGEELTWFGNFANEQAIEITVKGLRAAGWTGDNIADLVGLGEVDCEIKVVHEKDRDGETRAKIRWVNELGGGRFKFKEENQLNRGDVLDLASRVRAHAIASRQEQGRSGAQKKPAASKAPARGEWDGTGRVPGGGDDIPF